LIKSNFWRNIIRVKIIDFNDFLLGLKIVIIFFIARNTSITIFFSILEAGFFKNYYMELCFFGVQLPKINALNKAKILKNIIFFRRKIINNNNRNKFPRSSRKIRKIINNNK
jgi:hypothetical protein